MTQEMCVKAIFYSAPSRDLENNNDAVDAAADAATATSSLRRLLGVVSR